MKTLGYADLFIAEATGNPDLGIAPLYSPEEIAENLAKFPSPSELKAAYDSATERDGPAVRLRGFLWNVEFSSGDLLNKSLAFRPAIDGDRALWCEPAFDDAGDIVDLVWLDFEANEYGFSTGLADMLGKEQLSSAYTVESPLAVTDCPLVWSEHLDGVCILRKSARDALRKAAFVQADSFDLAEEIAIENFEGEPGRVLCPDDPYGLVLHLQEIAVESMRRTVRELTPFEYLERRRIERGGLPGEPLPPELTGVAL